MPDTPKDAESKLRFKRVLIVDNEHTLRKLLVRNLKSSGHEIQEARTAAEAIAYTEKQEPDLILLDVNLPDRSGLDVLRELRTRGKKTPAIIISRTRIPKSRLEELKPMAYLPKPFPLEALLRIVAGEPEEARNSFD